MLKDEIPKREIYKIKIKRKETGRGSGPRMIRDSRMCVKQETTVR